MSQTDLPMQDVPTLPVAPTTTYTSAPRPDSKSQCVNVLHVINGEHYSGAERVQDLLALRLPEFGYQVGFACVKPGQFAYNRKSKDSTVHWSAMRGKFDIRVVLRLVELIREHGYQLVHAHTPRTVMVSRLAAAWAKVPLVYHVHSPTSRDSTRGFANKVNTWIEKLSVRGAARLIPVSESLGRHMQSEGVLPKNLSVVPNGVPTLASVPHRDPPQGKWTIGTVALFRPRKGTEVLIDALADLHARGIKARLLCVGGFETPEYEPQLKDQVAEHRLEEDVERNGFTTDVNAQLRQMDLFALPSLFGEGLPMVVLEAMAAGIPVVATDVEGVPEAIRDGIDGVIAEPENADDLATAIARVITGELDWEELRLSALVRQHDHFSDQSMAAGVAKVYDEILAES